MDLDLNSISYFVQLVDEKGNCYPLENALVSLQWEEQESELAARASLVFADVNSELVPLLKLNCFIMIYAAANADKQKVFEGFIWEWEYSDGAQKTITVTACDPLIRLQQSKDSKYYSAGMSTQNIISDICKDWNIPLEYAWNENITHEKKVFSASAISDMINEILTEVKRKTGTDFIVCYRDNTIKIVGYGANRTVYSFTANTVISISDRLSMSNLVTRVKVLGTADDEGRSAVEAVLDGDTSYGVLQEIVTRDNDKTLADAQDEARNIISDNGKPEETITVSVPDVPFVHKGDAVKISAGTLSGYFFVRGISHNAAEKTMTVNLKRKE